MSLQPGPPEPTDDSALTPDSPEPAPPEAPVADVPAAGPPDDAGAAEGNSVPAPPPPPSTAPPAGSPVPPGQPSGYPGPAGWPAQPPAGSPPAGSYPGYAPPPPAGGWAAPPPPAPGYGYGPPPAQAGYPATPADYPPPGYPPQGYEAVGYAAAPQTDSKAVVGLILSISSWVVCPFVTAIIALVLAGQSNRAIDASGGRLTGRGMNTATKVISWINIVVTILGLMAFIALMVFAAASDTTFITELDGSTQF